MTSNLSHRELFGNVKGQNLQARAMIVNLRAIPLFPIIDEVLRVHDLDPIEPDNIDIPDDYL